MPRVSMNQLQTRKTNWPLGRSEAAFNLGFQSIYLKQVLAVLHGKVPIPLLLTSVTSSQGTVLGDN